MADTSEVAPPGAVPSDIAKCDGDAAGKSLSYRFSSQIVAGLKRRDDITILVENLSVTVLRLSESGPDITASFLDDRYVLAIGNWHDDFPSISLMLDFIERALDGALRVRRDYANDKLWRVTLEERSEDQTWGALNQISYPRFALRGAITTSYLQNVPRNGSPLNVSEAKAHRP